MSEYTYEEFQEAFASPDHTETYMLDNLGWMFFDEKFGAHRVVTQKYIKSVDPDGVLLPPLGSYPVVRELCNKCGGYGGEQVEDGWLSCYRCCEVGYLYSPLDEYLMDQLYVDAYEDEYQRNMKIEQSKRDALASLHIIGQSLNKLFDPPVEEVEDDIPF